MKIRKKKFKVGDEIKLTLEEQAKMCEHIRKQEAFESGAKLMVKSAEEEKFNTWLPVRDKIGVEAYNKLNINADFDTWDNTVKLTVKGVNNDKKEN